VRHKLVFGEEGSSTFPLIVLFGVILAFLMAFLFISLYNQQLNAQVDEQANALANNIAQTAFASLSGGHVIPLDLPRDVGGSPYMIEVQENSIFVVTITSGRKTGSSYNAAVNAIVVENKDQEFLPGRRIYFMRSGDMIIMSAELIQAPPVDIIIVPTGEPPEFYSFAKENTKVATAIIAAYYHTFEHIVDYWENEENKNSMIVQTKDNIFLRVNFYENTDSTGLVNGIWKIENAWIVLSVENLENFIKPQQGGEWKNGQSIENVENAWKSGWLYSPSQAIEQLRGRTWQRVIDNVMVTVPDNAKIYAAAVTAVLYQENVLYLTWRVEWQSDIDYVIYYRAMPWWEKDPDPGFIFQSSPRLVPMV